jgi:3-dehydroquinate dehydratase-2
MTKQIYVINGPNLNLLGVREPHIYGHNTLEDVHQLCVETAKLLAAEVVFMQSNIEGEIINYIQEARTNACALIINAAALTHTSIGIHDALKSLDMPIIEVHLSNPHAREEFRHKSYVSPLALGVVTGFGIQSYRLAIEGLRGKI